MSSRPSPQGRFCHPQVHTQKHRQTGLRDLPRCGDPRPSPRDTPRQVRAADQVRGRAASALAQVAFCRGSLRCGGRSVHRRGRSGVPGLHLPGASSSPCPGRPPPGDLGASPPHMTAVSRRQTPKVRAWRASSPAALRVARRRRILFRQAEVKSPFWPGPVQTRGQAATF